MVTADRNRRCWTIGSVFTFAIAVLTLAALSGCGHPMETGYADQSKTQVQFYCPPGATVTVQGGPTRSHQIPVYGAYGHRLEQTPEQFSVFNLSPGTYEFKYTAADGLPGVSVYGELVVVSPCTHEGRVLQRRAFIPISLPSEYYVQEPNRQGDEIFPYRGEAMRTAIDHLDLQRLKQGDVVEKVFIAADLEDAEEVRDKTRVALAAAEREIQYNEARFKEAFYDFRLDVGDPRANFWGTDREFIDREKKRQWAEIKWERLNRLMQRTEALLDGDHVLVRKGMLVVATEEIVEQHRDVVDAAKDIGEVLLVMRIGGRHMHWGEPGREMVAVPQ